MRILSVLLRTIKVTTRSAMYITKLSHFCPTVTDTIMKRMLVNPVGKSLTKITRFHKVHRDMGNSKNRSRKT